MYAIYGNIYHQYTPTVSIYTIYMDPMGHGVKHCLKPGLELNNLNNNMPTPYVGLQHPSS
jgi:hypothetical protein